jgi:hypothetical protein
LTDRFAEQGGSLGIGEAQLEGAQFGELATAT